MTTTSLSTLSALSTGWWNLGQSKAVSQPPSGITQRLMREDTMVQMLSEQSILVLLSALYFDDSGLANNSALTVYGADQIPARVRHAIKASPLTLVNDAFTEHVATVVIHAIFPEQAPGRAAE